MDAMDNNIGSLASGQLWGPEEIYHGKSTVDASSTEARLSLGKNFVLSGSIICVVGVLVYCMSMFSGDFSLSGNDSKFLISGLTIIAVGFLLWLFGAVKYLNAAIDAGSGEDVF